MKTPVCGFNENTSFAQSDITVYEIIEFDPKSESTADIIPTWYPRSAFSGISNEYAGSLNIGGLSFVSVTCILRETFILIVKKIFANFKIKLKRNEQQIMYINTQPTFFFFYLNTNGLDT